MDSKNRIIEEIKPFMPYVQEEFLISVANKGIYNRSVKDFEKIKDTITVELTEQNQLKISMEGDIAVVLNTAVQESVCSCPSSSICKHIIISLLYLKQYYENNKVEEIEEETESENKENDSSSTAYEELLELTPEKAQNLIGKRNFASILRSVQMERSAVFEYGTMLTVSLSSQNVKVYFPKVNSIQNAMCSCKEKGMCKHKAYSILAYLVLEKNCQFEAESAGFKVGLEEKEFLIRIKEYVGTLLDIGLSSLTEGEIKKIERLYIQAYGLKLFYLASELKSLSGEFLYYFNKNVSFSNQRIVHILCLIYNRAQAILRMDIKSEKGSTLIGVRKEESYILNQISLIGLGAVCRLTKRKDLLVNAYFYCHELKSMLALSTLRPTIGNNVTPEYLYTVGMLWSDDLSLKRVSSSRIILKDARISGSKLSGTKSTVCSIKGETSSNDLEELAKKDYEQLKKEIEQKAFQYFEPYSEVNSIYLIKTEKVDKIAFDKVNQKLNFMVYDSNDAMIELEIKYNAISENAIKYMERNQKSCNFSYILCSLFVRNGILGGTFLSAVNADKVNSIYFKER